jgi:hypothetical protein
MKKYFCILFLVTNHLICFGQITPLKIAGESSDTLKVDQVDKVCCNENSNLETVFIALDEILRKKYSKEKLFRIKYDSIKGEGYISYLASEHLKDTFDIDYDNFKFYFDFEMEKLNHKEKFVLSVPDSLIPSVVNFEIGGVRFKYLFEQYINQQGANNNENFTITTNCAIRIITKDSITGILNDAIDFTSFESVNQLATEMTADEDFQLQVSDNIVYKRHNKSVIVHNVQQTSEVLDTLIANLKTAGFDIIWRDGQLISVMYGAIGFSHE